MRFLVIGLSILCLSGVAPAQPEDTIFGSWELLPDKSTDIDLYRILTVHLQQTTAGIVAVNRWGGARYFQDSLLLPADGREIRVPITNRVFPSNVFMGLMMPVGEQWTVKGMLDGQRLRIDESFPLRGSQGITRATMTRTYELSENRELLVYRITRSTRATGPGTVYRFKRAGTRKAFVIRLQDDWDIRGTLDRQAFFISLQGAANATAPRLYLLYPDNWPFTYVQSVFEFYKEKRHITFTELRTAEEALKALRNEVKGYVVWDKNVRTSLIVAYTAAGLEQAVVVSEEMIPMMERAGLKKVEDLRGLFTGQNDAQIYSWAYKKYWDRCSREFIVWLGGEHGTVMKPAVADWGMHKKVFFNDLSSKPADTAEYALANRLLAGMKPMSMVMGWHSYAKDLERDHVKLTSSYGHRVEGLHTVPNVSFRGLHLLHPDRRDGARRLAASGPRGDPLRLGGPDELHLDGAGHGRVLLYDGHPQRLHDRLPLRPRLHVPEGRAEEVLLAAPGHGARSDETDGPESVRDDGLFRRGHGGREHRPPQGDRG